MRASDVISTADRTERPTWIVLGRTDDGVVAAMLDAARRRADTTRGRGLRIWFASWVAETEAGVAPRWVWSDAPAWYAALLAAGVRRRALPRPAAVPRDPARVVARHGCRRRCVRRGSGMPRPPSPRRSAAPALFDWDDDAASARGGPPAGLGAALDEFARQRAAIAASADPGRLRLLIAAESAGALIAEELRAAGLPWDAAAHDRILDRDARRAPGRGRRAGEARRRRGARARGARAIPARASTRSRSCCARCTAPACSSNRRAAGSSPSSGIRSSSRCSSTRSSRACSRRTAGRGSRSGCTTGASGPCTCRAASSPGGGRRRAAARCSCRGSCARPCGPIPAGCSSSPTSPSWSPGCSPRWRRDTGAGGCGARARPLRRHRRERRGGDAARGEDRDPRGDVRRDDGGVGAARAAPAPDLSARDGPRRRRRAHRRGRRAASRPGSAAPRRRRPRGGRRRSPARPRPRHPERTRPAPVARRAIAAGSRATSSCRGPPRSGRSRGSPSCARASRPCRRWRRRMPPTAPDPVFARHPHLAFFLHDEVIVHTPAALRRRGRAGGAGGRGIGRAAALRRLPDRLPARRPHRASPRSRTEPRAGTQAPRLDSATRMGRLDGRVARGSPLAPRNVRAPQGRAVGNTHPE